jgi:predicted dinucleotide-binding enzyme
MKIGIIGSGVVGQQLGLGFIRTDHEIKIGTRDTSKLSDWQKNAGTKGSSGSFEEAASFGELIVLCTLWDGTKNAIDLAGTNNFTGKILIDVTNPLDFSKGSPPILASAFRNSGGEQVQKWLPDAKVVKAFNIVNAHIMINPNMQDGMPDMFIAGNDTNAKQKVIEIIEQLGWKGIHDLGDISMSYWLETFAMLWIHYGFKNNHWAHAFKLLKK